MIDRPAEQIAYVTHELDRTVADLGRTLGIRRWRAWTFDNAFLRFTEYHSQPADISSVVAMPEFGASIEVIQPLLGPSIYTTFLEERGEGLHHIGYFVDDLAAERAAWSERGFREIFRGGGHGLDGDGEFLFIDTMDALGSYVEVISPPRRRSEPHFRIELDEGWRPTRIDRDA